MHQNKIFVYDNYTYIDISAIKFAKAVRRYYYFCWRFGRSSYFYWKLASEILHKLL